jgi:hypothetical protein
MASEEKNSSKLNNLNWILWIAIILFIGLLLIYYFNIFESSPDKKGEWGTFGDFIGGTLNPLFALFSLFAIIYTIKIQTKELEYTREELEATREELIGSRIAQQEQSESLKLQNAAIEKQIFENTFFSLLKEVNGLLKEFYTDENGLAVYDIIKELSDDRIYLKKEELRNKFNLLNIGVMRNYFMMLYQILKFIDNSSSNINKKTYSNIVRANSGNYILSLLAINCYSNDFSQFKEYLEKYSFFEHLDISSDVLFFIEVILKEYFTDLKIYGKNKELIKLF